MNKKMYEKKMGEVRELFDAFIKRNNLAVEVAFGEVPSKGFVIKNIPNVGDWYVHIPEYEQSKVLSVFTRFYDYRDNDTNPFNGKCNFHEWSNGEGFDRLYFLLQARICKMQHIIDGYYNIGRRDNL